jgi:RNA polymerase sigma-70 factor (ECF subfamily)
MQGEGQLLQSSDCGPTVAEDAALVEAVALGDRDALATLYDLHSPLVLGLAKRMVGPAAAEDLLHDVFLEVWHHAGDYSPGRGSVRAWLLVRTRSRALDCLGKRVRDARVAEQAAQLPSHGETFAPGPHASPHASPHESGVDARRVGQLANQLAPELVRVLELAYFEGLSCSEIAGTLALPVGTVKSRLARALARLREAVGFHEGGDDHG